MRRTRGISLLLLLLGIGSLHAQQAGRYGHYEVYDTDLLPREEYAGRRSAGLSKLDSSSALLVRAADIRTRSNDVDYEFRQRNNMLYLTGVTEEKSALLLVPHGISVDGTSAREILFVQARNPSMETWTGITMGPDVAAQVTGIRLVLPYSRLGDILNDLLPAIDTLYYDGWLHGVEKEPLTGTLFAWDREMKKRLEGKAAKLQIRPAGSILNMMRVIKSPAEIALMRRAIDISVEAHRETIRHARPGMHEYELEAIMEYNFKRLGAEEPGYPSIVGSGSNSCILHYESNRRQTEPGNMIVMDCGAEYHGYSADVTRTIPIGGKFSPEQRAIYDLVLDAQKEAIGLCRVGASFQDPHRKAVEIIGSGLVKLGIISDESEYMKYFMHGTSHFLGMDVHDVGDMSVPLASGMVMTVEPGIYIAPGSPCDPKWWGIGVRIEDDILVTNDGPVNLSGKLERGAEEIERLMGGNP
jgi:Xaa-Pro aminopeptidase